MLMRVRGFSRTGVLLEFSNLESVSALSPNQFIIVDSGGSQLAINRTAFSGSSAITLDTSAQVPEKCAIIGLLQPIAAADSTATRCSCRFRRSASSGYRDDGWLGRKRAMHSQPGRTNTDAAVPGRSPAADSRPIGDWRRKSRRTGTYDVGSAFWVGSVESRRATWPITAIYDNAVWRRTLAGPTIGTTKSASAMSRPGVFGVK